MKVANREMLVQLFFKSLEEISILKNWDKVVLTFLKANMIYGYDSKTIGYLTPEYNLFEPIPPQSLLSCINYILLILFLE